MQRPALLAQLVEHFHGKEGVNGSSPLEGFVFINMVSEHLVELAMTSDQDWEEVEVQKSKPVGVVVSVCLPKPDADRLAEEAHRRDLPVSSLLREAINLLLSAPRLDAYRRMSRVDWKSAESYCAGCMAGRGDTGPGAPRIRARAWRICSSALTTDT